MPIVPNSSGFDDCYGLFAALPSNQGRDSLINQFLGFALEFDIPFTCFRPDGFLFFSAEYQNVWYSRPDFPVLV